MSVCYCPNCGRPGLEEHPDKVFFCATCFEQIQIFDAQHVGYLDPPNPAQIELIFDPQLADFLDRVFQQEIHKGVSP